MVAGGPGGVPARCHPQVHHGSCSSSRGGREGGNNRGEVSGDGGKGGEGLAVGEGEFRLLLDGAVKEEEGRTTNGGQTMR